MNSTIIKKIELDIDGVGVVLTPEQAKKLQGALNELLGVEKEKEYLPSPYYVWPYVTPYRPYRIGDTYTYTATNGTAVSSVGGVGILCSGDTMKLSV